MHVIWFHVVDHPPQKLITHPKSSLLNFRTKQQQLAILTFEQNKAINSNEQSQLWIHRNAGLPSLQFFFHLVSCDYDNHK